MKVASVLESVTVYRQGAVCTRTARVEPVAVEDLRVRIVGLPLVAKPGSLRARVLDRADLHVVDVRAGFDVELGTDTDLAAEVRAVEAAQEHSGRVALAIDRIDRELAEMRGLLPSFREPPRREPPREAPLVAMLALGDLVETRMAELATRRRALAIELEDAKERERTAAARLREAGTAARTARATVARAAIVTLTGTPDTACTIAIEYEVPGARWVPTYQLALGDGGGALAMRASIAQRTGEDWTAVRLALSTASLRRRTAIPELRSLRVGRAQAEPQRAGWREPPPGLEGLFADYEAAAVLRPPKARTVMTRMAAPPVPPPLAAPAPMMFGAPGGAASGGMPPPPPQMASMSPAPMVARAMAAPMLQQAPARPSRARAESNSYQANDGAEMDDLELPESLSESTGAALSLPPEPSGPSQAQLDYEMLEINGPEGSQRGRLAPAAAHALAFASVTVQIEVVASAVTRAELLAASVAHAPVPRDCIPPMEQDRFDYRFDAIAPADVPATGAWTNVKVMDCAVDLAPRYVCVPAVDPAVYRTLEVGNRSSHALLPGPLDVSKHGQFLLTTMLGPVGPGVRGRRIGLGVEESIKVARNTRFAETSAGLFRGTTALPHEIDIDVDNRLGVPIELEVRERMPVVGNDEKDLEVEENEITPPWTAVDEPPGGMLVHGLRRWRVTVVARANTKLVAKFTIKMPADRMLVGGNRRS